MSTSSSSSVTISITPNSFSLNLRSLPGSCPTPSFHSMALMGSKSLPSLPDSFLSPAFCLLGEDAPGSGSGLLQLQACFVPSAVIANVDITTLPPGGAEDSSTVDGCDDVTVAVLMVATAGRIGCTDAIHDVAPDVLVMAPLEGTLPRGMPVTIGTNCAGTCARSFAPGGSTVPGVMNGARSVVIADCTRVICPATWWLNRVTAGAGRIITVVPLTNAGDMGSCADSDAVARGAARQRFGGNFILGGMVEIRLGVPMFVHLMAPVVGVVSAGSGCDFTLTEPFVMVRLMAPANC